MLKIDGKKDAHRSNWIDGRRHYLSKSMSGQTIVNLLIQDANYFKNPSDLTRQTCTLGEIKISSEWTYSRTLKQTIVGILFILTI